LKNDYIINLNIQVPVQKLEHVHRLLGQTSSLHCRISKLSIYRKWASDISTGSNSKNVYFSQSRQSWHSI